MSPIKLVPPPFNIKVSDELGRMSDAWQRHTLKTQTTLASDVAPADARYVTVTADSRLTQETNLGALAAGYLKQTVAAGVASPSTVAAIPATDVTAPGSDQQVVINNGGVLGATTLAKTGTGTMKLSGSSSASLGVQNGSNLEYGAMVWDGSNSFRIGTQGGVNGGTARDTIIGTAATLYFATNNGTTAWVVQNDQHLRPFADASYDLGTSSDQVRDIYASRTYIGHALRLAVVTKTFADTPYTVAATDFLVLVDATSGAVTVTLPTATAGRILCVKKIDNSINAVTLGGTIDGTASPTLALQYQSRLIVADGSAWNIIASI